MKKALKLIWVLLLAATVLLAACRRAPAESSPTTQPEAVLTAAAQTAEAQLTELAEPTVTSTLTPTPAVTLVPLTPSPTAGLTLPAGTETAPVGTVPVATSGDLAEYWADVTIPDGTNFGPGESFTKTWRIINSGTTTWTTDYSLAYLGGDQMSGPASVALTTTVAPGDTVDVSVDMAAPEASGNYQGFWKMRNAAGAFFDFAVFVEINVVGGGAAPTATAGSGGAGSGDVSAVSLTVDEASPDSCPNTFNFTGSFTLDAAATVTYRLDAGSDTPGFTFTLPAEQSSSYEAGTHSLSFTLEISDTMNGWVQFHITEPDEETSDQVAISLTCD
jgi:hypothetical protein